MNRADRRRLTINDIEPESKLEEELALQYVEHKMVEAKEKGTELRLSEVEFIETLKKHRELTI
jgi:hypothetical protein